MFCKSLTQICSRVPGTGTAYLFQRQLAFCICGAIITIAGLEGSLLRKHKRCYGCTDRRRGHTAIDTLSHPCRFLTTRSSRRAQGLT